MSLPFIDLQSQYRRIQDDLESAVLSVLRSGQYILGPEVERLEQELAAYVGTHHCVTCASGTDALLIALMAQGIGPGDAVFAPTFTFFATAEVIALLGATPVFVDIDPHTFNVSASALERALEALAREDRAIHPLPRKTGLRARAVIPVDLFGLAADYDALNEVAARHGLTVIEDAAQSFGATYRGRRAGALAPIGCTSFFPAKPLGAYGDGGALFTDDAALAATFRSIRVHGQGEDRYENVRLGLTGRLDAVQAAVLRTKLKVFDDELRMRQIAAARYGEVIGAAGLPLTLPAVAPGYLSAWAQYCVLAADEAARAVLLAKLKTAGVPTAIYYPKPLHRQPAFSDLGYREGDFPASDDAARRIFAIPMHPYLDDAAIATVVAAMQ